MSENPDRPPRTSYPPGLNPYFEEAISRGYGEKVEMPRPERIPAEFEQSALSINGGAKTVYREDREEDSLQLRIYEDRATVELDRYNPEYYPVKHAVQDATKYTVASIVGVTVMLSALTSG